MLGLEIPPVIGGLRMCGIVGYIGFNQASDFLLDGMAKLEYRGYDSAGIAVIGPENVIKIQKKVGRLANLEAVVKADPNEGTVGIGHTRWATHGRPSDMNAHPHASEDGKFAVVHNGIIENYMPLKEELIAKGYHFKSETDTEVVAHLLEDMYDGDFVGTVRRMLARVDGAYALEIICSDEPDKIICTKKENPLVIGLGKGENFVASDIPAIINYTRDTYILSDGELAIVTRDNVSVFDREGKPVDKEVFHVNWNAEAAEKGGYEHFMLKEIFEQPASIQDTMRGRLLEDGTTKISGINNNLKQFLNADRIIIAACGTSWHAGLVGEYLFEELTRIPVEVEYASEFRYRNPVINSSDIVMAISQSGETADTLAALKLAKERGAFIYGICNVVGSSIARLTDSGTYTHAGPEIGVASTKAFTTQLTVLTLLALHLGHKKGTIDHDTYKRLCKELAHIPDLVAKTIEMNKDKVIEIARAYKDVSNCIYLGRGYNYPVALEGALKLKEISYIHAEGYPAAEMKHGPIALIDENMPVVFLAPSRGHYEKVVSNAQEIKARKGKIIAVVTEHDCQMSNLADHVLEIPEVEELFSPILSVIPLQLLSYHIATMRGCNVDQPRNLAKSVTVE